ncbi:hypothetical protein ROZALSC1DRAFT_30150 [Rozella allomycis CSF55]|uniref:Uncharacterized protein n=1 Tax=Rozella allomycis (strain CSF55) TaxID=988480 RepID=A0A075AYE9_ROZAC|nr:hypothetical protein O9G_000703 [Rozella allomycis CSF55]RKP18119.1 hypothetical protein ROZALSC1DRAFT_30150 [Rozella allomycis CSF55]|eukprot:EPZ35307.1 hypothetical protein O9G_000703 [Rozella allomycis CSF55]
MVFPSTPRQHWTSYRPLTPSATPRKKNSHHSLPLAPRLSSLLFNLALQEPRIQDAENAAIETGNPNVFMEGLHLTEMPPAFPDLKFTYGSLSNQLEEIAPSIRELVNLKELSLSFNQLNHLPWEIQLLQKLCIFVANPNPWMDSIEPEADIEPCQSLKNITLNKVVSNLEEYNTLPPLIQRQVPNEERICYLCGKSIYIPWKIVVVKQNWMEGRYPFQTAICSFNCSIANKNKE